MRTFDHFPKEKTCPLCGDSTDGKTVLIPIEGTNDGNIWQAQPVHLACIEPERLLPLLAINAEVGVLYARIKEG